MRKPLEGWGAVVTGASSGIGVATATALAEVGASVALLARRGDRLQALAEEIQGTGGASLALPVDITKRQEVERAIEEAHRAFGRIDVLVNNAGIMPLSPLESLRVQDWEAMVDVNLKGVLYGISAVLPLMLRQERGHIVNIGSVAGRRPFKTGVIYSATKFAVRALSAGIHLELSASRGIRVTDIQPGVVDTELTNHIPEAETRESFRERWEGKRMLLAQDIAEAVLYAVTAPAHVNVNEILVRPTDQPV